MKVLIDHSVPFSLAHGGLQKQIEETKRALERRGIDVEYVRWWDDGQKGTLIHSFGIPSSHYLDVARKNKMPVVVTSVFSATCNRSAIRLKTQGLIVQTMIRSPGWSSIKRQLNWESFADVNCNIVGLNAEKEVLRLVYGVENDKIHVVPLGLSQEFLESAPAGSKGDHLITVGTITPAKGSVDLARLARTMQVPILFVGKPISDQDSYWREFNSLVDDRFVRYLQHVDNLSLLSSLFRKARGFVLYSEYENWSLAAHEAAACGLPLLLPDLKWSRERFGDGAYYFRNRHSAAARATLQWFYEQATRLQPPEVQFFSWDEIAIRLEQIYLNVTRR